MPVSLLLRVSTAGLPTKIFIQQRTPCHGGPTWKEDRHVRRMADLVCGAIAVAVAGEAN
jgi:hypothetical protein